MARNRALSRTPATIAAAAPAPAASTAVDPNCAAPANTNADITIAASGPITGRATTPKDRPSSPAAAPNGRPARMPSRIVAERSVVGAADMAGQGIGRVCSVGRGDEAPRADRSRAGAGPQPSAHAGVPAVPGLQPGRRGGTVQRGKGRLLR